MDNPYDPQQPFESKYFLRSISTYELNTLLARSKSGGNILTRAIQTEKYQSDWPAARTLYETILASPDADPASIRYARDRIQTNKWQQTLDTGQWVSLMFDDHLAGWRPLLGQWKRIDQNTIQGTNGDLPMRIEPMVSLGKYYEWQMTIHFIHKAKGPALMAGIVYAYENQPEHYGQFGQFLRHQPGSTWVHMGGYEPYRSGNVDIPEKVTCTIIVKNGHFTVLLDDKEIQKPVWVMQGTSFLKLAMGTAFSRNPGSIIQYSNIKVRKLPKPLPAAKPKQPSE